MYFESFQFERYDKRSVYTIWLRISAFILIITAAFFVFAFKFIGSLNQGLPWDEESRILMSGTIPVRHPSCDQPKLDEVLRYKTSPVLDGLPCGHLDFFISPEGIVKGLWTGEYDTSQNVRCTILAASFTGNIDPSKTCIEGKRHDQSKLYFITKGGITMLKAGDFGNNGFDGSIYFRGWLDPNYTVTGELFVTQNKKTYEVFTCVADEVAHITAANVKR